MTSIVYTKRDSYFSVLYLFVFSVMEPLDKKLTCSTQYRFVIFSLYLGHTHNQRTAIRKRATIPNNNRVGAGTKDTSKG